MAFEEITCVVPVCDGCGPDWQDDGPLHFVNTRSALTVLTDHGWRVTTTESGEITQMLCPGCAIRDTCATDGHAWEPMNPTAEHPLAVDSCARCCRIRRLDEPPEGHPDSMTVELSRADETWLAAVDADLFPEEAK